MTWNSEVKIDTRCAVCDTPLAGYRLNERNGRYYCIDHFQKTSPEELRVNQQQKKKGDDWDNFYNSLQ